MCKETERQRLRKRAREREKERMRERDSEREEISHCVAGPLGRRQGSIVVEGFPKEKAKTELSLS